MKEFRKQYQNEPVDFHLWSQDKIAEFWWRAALEWSLKSGYTDDYGEAIINPWDIEEELGGE